MGGEFCHSFSDLLIPVYDTNKFLSIQKVLHLNDFYLVMVYYFLDVALESVC